MKRHCQRKWVFLAGGVLASAIAAAIAFGLERPATGEAVETALAELLGKDFTTLAAVVPQEAKPAALKDAADGIRATFAGRSIVIPRDAESIRCWTHIPFRSHREAKLKMACVGAQGKRTEREFRKGNVPSAPQANGEIPVEAYMVPDAWSLPRTALRLEIDPLDAAGVDVSTSLVFTSRRVKLAAGCSLFLSFDTFTLEGGRPDVLKFASSILTAGGVKGAEAEKAATTALDRIAAMTAEQRLRRYLAAEPGQFKTLREPVDLAEAALFAGNRSFDSAHRGECWHFKRGSTSVYLATRSQSPKETMYTAFVFDSKGDALWEGTVTFNRGGVEEEEAMKFVAGVVPEQQ